MRRHSKSICRMHTFTFRQSEVPSIRLHGQGVSVEGILPFILTIAPQLFTGLCLTLVTYIIRLPTSSGNVGPCVPRRLIIPCPGPEFTYRSLVRSAANDRTGGLQTKIMSE